MRYNVNEDYKDFIFTYRTFNIHYGEENSLKIILANGGVIIRILEFD